MFNIEKNRNIVSDKIPVERNTKRTGVGDSVS